MCMRVRLGILWPEGLEPLEDPNSLPASTSQSGNHVHNRQGGGMEIGLLALQEGR